MDDLQAKVSVKAEEMYPEISEQKKYMLNNWHR